MYDIFGKTTNGEIVNSFQLSNSTGLEMNVITYGGIITSLLVPSENGEKIDVVLGCNSLDEYINNTSYLGAIIGRYGNRIGGAKFSLDGNEYQLAKNDNDKNRGSSNARGLTVAFNIQPVISKRKINRNRK